MRIQKFRLEMVKESGSNYNFVRDQLSHPDDVYRLLNEIFKLDIQAEEVFVCLCLDMKLNVIGAFEISRGILDSALVHPREIFKRAILCNAASIFIAHNHPSGCINPSDCDYAITKRIVEAGQLLGVKVEDHIIVGDNRYFSFKENYLI